MGVQTGVETPRGPASQQLGDRVRFRVDRWRAEPNALWMREMRQSARLMRTPVILMVLTILMTMLMSAIGGVLTGSASPASAGTALFHVFFSLAYFVVTLVGPALAANSIASEREGHTWEAVLLTGMRPSEVARGKFLAAYTSIALYVVALAPVGALPFLFGGITPLEVLVAFLFLFLIALLGVAFGLAISSKMTSLRVALLVTLLLAIPISLFGYLGLGLGLSFAAHELWPGVAGGPPVWLPTAYSRAPFGIEYLVYLVALPVVGITLPAWFLYEVTNANLTSVTDDRSRGLKRWFLVASLAMMAAAAVPMFAGDLADISGFIIAGLIAFFLFILFNAFLFSGEPIGPSRRVQSMLARAGWLRRVLAPGVTRATVLQLVFGLLGVVVLSATGLAYIGASGAPRATEQMEQVILFSAYTAGFAVFNIGLAAYLRARAKTSAVPRVLLLVFLFVLCTGPWILAAIAGVLTAGSGGAPDEALAVASPSPFYVFVAIDAVSKPDPGVAVVASMGWSIVYGLAGFVFVTLAAARCRKIIVHHEAVLAEADRRLAEEDRRRVGALTVAAGQPDPSATAPDEPPAPDVPAPAEPTGEASAREQPIPTTQRTAAATDGDGAAEPVADDESAPSPPDDEPPQLP